MHKPFFKRRTFNCGSIQLVGERRQCVRASQHAHSIFYALQNLEAMRLRLEIGNSFETEKVIRTLPSVGTN
jgi:aromatic ring-cleaving dioxygenase